MIKKILVSQPKPTSEKSPYFEIASKYGVEVVFRPFIKIEGLSAKEFRQQKVSILDYTAVVFTSRNAIDHFFLLCKELRVTIPEDMKYFCITETIALYIQKYVQYRKRKGFFGSTGNHEPVGFQEAYPQGSGNVPHCEQRFQERREVRLRHADFLQPLGYTGFAEKLP